MKLPIANIISRNEQNGILPEKAKEEIVEYLEKALGQCKEDGSYSTAKFDARYCEMIRTKFPNVFKEVFDKKSK